MYRENKELYEFDKFRLDVSERYLLKSGRRVALTDRAFDTLCVLIRRGNRLISKDELMTEVWADAIVEENNLDKNISALRRILGERGDGKQKFIETVRGHGYRFVAEVRQISDFGFENGNHNGNYNDNYNGSHNGDRRLTTNGELTTKNQKPKIIDQKLTTNDQKAEIIDQIPNPKSQIPNPKSNTVAVLPFKLVAVAADDEYLGIGMADALIVSLSKIVDLQVRPTASVVPFAASGANPIAAGRELKVEAILDGKIHQSGDDLRVNLQLIRVADGGLLWAEKFDGSMSGIFRLEDEISAFVARKLRRDLDENALRILTTRGTESLAAYRAFLKARFHFHQGSPEDYQKSDAFYAEAIRLDPNYAQAYAGLADVYILEVIFNLRRPQDAFAQTEEAVTKAVELDPTSAEVYAARANFNMCLNRDLAEAGRSASKAVELDSYSANAHNLLGQSLAFRGFYAEAEIAIKQALEIDPLGFWHSCALTVCYFLWREHDRAIAQTSTTTAINPKLYAETIKRCWSLTELGRHAEAFALYEEVSTQPGGQTAIWFVGNAYAVAGEPEKARAVLAQLKELSEHHYTSPFFFALIHAGLNETQEAIDCLEQTVENRDPWMLFIYADPRLDNLRSDSRFQRLVNLVVPEAARIQDDVPAPTNFTASSEPNQNNADAARGERETRTISATALISRKTARIAAGVALTSLAFVIFFAVYKFAYPAPMLFEARKTTRLTATGKVNLAAVAPDGKFIAYAQEEDGERQSLWMRHVTNESGIQIAEPSPVEYRGLDISPDGNWLYYVVGRGSLYRMSALGGTARKIADGLYTGGGGNVSVGISPEGERIAFVRRFEKDASALFLVNADGTNEQTLAAFEQPTRLSASVVWSPDGKFIACREIVVGGHNILAVRVADGTSAPIMPREWNAAIRQIAWMPDSKSLLMISGGQMYQVSHPGGDARQINADADQRVGIGLTADARILATVKAEIAAYIWTMPGDGDASRARQLTAGFEKADGVYGLNWTADGRVVYDSAQNGENSIWSVGANGGNSKQILKGDGYPAVSPDNRFIIYHRGTEAANVIGLRQIDARDAREKRLTNGADAWQTFSPDGRWLVFTRYAERVGLWKMPSAGGEPVLLLDENAICPAVSPDGKVVAFILRRAGEANRIALVAIDGGEILKILDAKLERTFVSDKQNLQWTADGRGIYFIALNNDVSNIWRQPIDGGSPVQVTNFKDGRIFNFAFSPDGSQLALSRGTLNSDVVLIENQN